jgi:hypothetical protein
LALGFAERMQRHLGPHLDAADLAVLDRLVGDGPQGIAQRADATLEVSRRLYLATAR